MASELPVFWDTETCGFHGMPVLLQYAYGWDDPTVHDLWYEPCGKTFEIIDKMLVHPGGNVLFNATFDLFHIIKFYTTAKRVTALTGVDISPVDWVDEFGIEEEHARLAPYTLKWAGLCDLMLVAMQGPYQSMMNRKDIRIKRIPTVLAPHVADYLESKVPLADALFARRKKKSKKWKVFVDEDDPDYADIVVKFAPSRGLKVIAADAGMTVETTFDDLSLDAPPIEYGYAPYAKAGVVDKLKDVLPTGPGKWRGTWPDRIKDHAATWKYVSSARKYAYDDPIMTRTVWEFLGKPPMNDANSVLTNTVASCRWRGFAIDKPAITEQLALATTRSKQAPTAPNAVKTYVYESGDLSEGEKLFLEDAGYSTKAIVLEAVAEWPTEAGKRATAVIEARGAQKKADTFRKLLHAGRFHASFKVLGTLSDRMSGADGLNAQGIDSTKEVRKSFPLRDYQMSLSGGDFNAFEVSIAAAVYNDPALNDALINGVECPTCFGTDKNCPVCEGKERLKEIRCPSCRGDGCPTCDEEGFIGVKLHALFAEALFPEYTLVQILLSKGTDNDLYSKGKKGIFAMLFGGNENTLETRLGVSLETAIAAFENFGKMYPGVQRFRDGITKDYCSMTQPAGIGSRVIWKDPLEYAESIFGFRRYFTLENTITKALFELGENPPKSWLDVRVKVLRRDRVQTAGNAVRSALFAAAFGVQGKCLRAAANHFIQSPGADITKDLQVNLWSLQPVGACPWHIQPFNVHDEINTCWDNNYVLEEQLNSCVDKTINKYIKKIPLLSVGWKNNLQSWAEKG